MTQQGSAKAVKIVMKLYLPRLAVSCCLLLATAATAGAADVSYYGIIKSIQYEQTNDSAPTVLPTNAYAFHAFALASTNNVLTNATVAPPLHALVPDDTNAMSLRWMEQFTTQAALDSAYPTGSFLSPANYTITMGTTNDGVKSGSLNFFILIVPVSFPTTPQLTNFAAAQAVDTTRDFQLGWKSLGGSTVAIVQLTIMDPGSNVVHMTPAPFEPGALSGTSFSATIPAYSLPPGTNLIGHLTIANPGMPNTNSYVGATGISAMAKDTQFSLVTRPAPAAPRLTVLPAQPDEFALRLEGEPNRTYQIEATPDFQTWTSLLTTNLQNGIFDYTDTNLITHSFRYYRGKVGQ